MPVGQEGHMVQSQRHTHTHLVPVGEEDHIVAQLSKRRLLNIANTHTQFVELVCVYIFKLSMCALGGKHGGGHPGYGVRPWREVMKSGDGERR